ncbi:hypothetical protein [Zooshikella harenae]|uniref:Uncharacterized protein n=1 Tax=Zooshikella harenae TaxID=2827238 RepID=A0ABS5ZIE5_9GAMM|nr:hypothetical protein [Zooshikella harenae]MBU2713553.1 hypothetical protein [Zooshikella harenae]
MHRIQGWFHTFCITSTCLLLVSCINLTAVHEWSQTSLNAVQYSEIVTTYADTPQRLQRYDPGPHWANQIEKRTAQAQLLQQLLTVIADYMSSLVTLSADSTINYTNDVQSLSKLDTHLSTNTQQAASGIVNTLLEAAARGYQAQQIEEVITKANGPLQQIMKGELRTIIDQDFRQDLRIEKLSINRYYNSLLEQKRYSQAAKVALLEWKEFRLTENLKRQKAIDAYLNILDDVAKGHQELYNNRDQLDIVELSKALYGLARTMRKHIKVILH